MNAARLPEARLRFPQWAEQEREAEARLRLCVATGDITGGSHALADWIDAQVAMLVYLDLDEPERLQ